MGKLVYVDTILDLDGRDAVILGRHREADLPISDGNASRQHCKVFRAEGSWFIQDLDSANGTLLNGRPVHGREALHHEDIIAIGASRVQVQLPETAPEPVEKVRRSQAAQGVLGNPDTLVGRQLGGFILRRLAGRSPLGALFIAEQPALTREASVTIVAPEALDGVGTPAEALATLTAQKLPNDPGLPERFDCGLDAELGLVWIAGAKLSGESIIDLATRGTVGVLEAILLLERIAKVVAVLHGAGVVHGLLDGEAAILDEDGRVRLRDPGVAGALAGLPGSTVRGDPAFSAPEGRVDVAGDIYALGCLLHLLVAGRTPFRASTADAWRAAHRDNPIPSIAGQVATAPADVGKQLDQVLQGLLAKNPEWRYHSVAEFLAELAPVREALSRNPGRGSNPAKIKSASVEPVKVPTATASTIPTPGGRGSERVEAARRRRQVRTGLGLAVIVVLIIAGWQTLNSLPTGLRDGADTPDDANVSGHATLPWMGPQRRDPPLLTEPQIRAPATSAPDSGTTTIDSAAKAWTKTRAEIETMLSQGDFGAAEMAVQAALTPPPQDGERARDVQRLADRVRRQGQAWYQNQLATVTSRSEVVDIVAALKTLAHVRDTALRADRLDAATRFEEARQRLRQHVADSRRDARLRVEAGDYAGLTALAATVEQSFRGTPGMAEVRAFLAQCRQAAGLAQLFPKTPWTTVARQLPQQTGAAALAGAAVLLLLEDEEKAAALLARPELAEPPLVIAREALRGREAAVLSFDHPSDLRFIETVLGQPSLADGVLSGPRGEPVALRVAVPFDGDDWEVGLTLLLADVGQDAASGLISCGTNERRDVQVQINATGLRLRVRNAEGWSQQDSELPPAGPLRLLIRCQGGTVTIRIQDQERFTVPQVHLPGGSQLGVEVVGAEWRLDDLRVIGG